MTAGKVRKKHLVSHLTITEGGKLRETVISRCQFTPILVELLSKTAQSEVVRSLDKIINLKAAKI